MTDERGSLLFGRAEDVLGTRAACELLLRACVGAVEAMTANRPPVVVVADVDGRGMTAEEVIARFGQCVADPLLLRDGLGLLDRVLEGIRPRWEMSFSFLFWEMYELELQNAAAAMRPRGPVS